MLGKRIGEKIKCRAAISHDLASVVNGASRGYVVIWRGQVRKCSRDAIAVDLRYAARILIRVILVHCPASDLVAGIYSRGDVKEAVGAQQRSKISHAVLNSGPGQIRPNQTDQKNQTQPTRRQNISHTASFSIYYRPFPLLECSISNHTTGAEGRCPSVSSYKKTPGDQ